jgi:tetratricopeptide (TPR) repeat protein
MGKKIRITRKTLKQDEVRSYGVELWTWARENEKSLLIGVAVVMAVFLFVQAYSCRKAGREARVDMLITSAMMNIQGGLVVAKDDANRERLFGAAEDNLQMVVSDYRRSRLAPYADYLLGNIAFLRNNYDDAEKYYQQYLTGARTPTEKAEGYIALGYTYENKFFWTQPKADRKLLDDALDSYIEAESLTSGTMEHYIAMLGRARLYDLQLDRQEQAKEVYEQIARERQIPQTVHSPEVKRSRYEWVVNEMERMRRLFLLSETARLRAERLEAGK